VGRCERKKRSENGLKYLKKERENKGPFTERENIKKSYKTSFAMGLGRG
jgi:hypothetical protein